MPPSKSKLQAVVEESTQNAPSVTTAVKNIAHVLLGPRGQTPIDSIIQMQHYQLWGFILIVAGLLYIVWLMQKKLDSIDKQYKEQFVLLHRLFKSHQDLQVEVRRKPNVVQTATTVPPVAATTTTVENNSLELEEEDELVFDSSPAETERELDESEREPNEPERELDEPAREPNAPECEPTKSDSELDEPERESSSVEEYSDVEESVSEQSVEEEQEQEDYEVFE